MIISKLVWVIFVILLIKFSSSIMEKFIRDKWERKSFIVSNNDSTPAASQEDLILLPTPSLSSTNSSLVSSPIPQPQQQHVFASRNFVENSSSNPFLINPFTANFEGTTKLIS
jgi:hypothetical protein